jgi:tetratricopeptide (TPR) repeat protein
MGRPAGRLVAVALAAAAAAACVPPRSAPIQPTASVATSAELRDPELRSALVAAAVHPTAGAHRRVAEAYRRLEITDLAFDHLTRALAIDPDDAAALDARARIWRDWGALGRALEDSRRAVDLAPGRPEIQNTLGTILHGHGDLAGAAAAFSAALIVDPEAVYALSNLCYVSFLQGLAPDALNACRKAVRIAPDLATSRINLALALALEDPQAGERSLAAVGDATTARYNVGILFLARRDFNRAADVFETLCRRRVPFADSCTRATQALAHATGPR